MITQICVASSLALHATCCPPANGQTPIFCVILPFVGNLLKHLYDADVVSEDAMLSWAGSGAKSILKSALGPFRTACQPFIDWLQEAEESEGEEDDDEDE